MKIKMLGGRGTINSNTNNIVYGSTESSYESPSKDLDLAHEPCKAPFQHYYCW